MLPQTNLQQTIHLFSHHFPPGKGEHAEDDDGTLALLLGDHLLGACMDQLSFPPTLDTFEVRQTVSCNVR